MNVWARLRCRLRGGCADHRVELGLGKRPRWPYTGLYACARCRRLWIWVPAALCGGGAGWLPTTAAREWGSTCSP